MLIWRPTFEISDSTPPVSGIEMMEIRGGTGT